MSNPKQEVSAKTSKLPSYSYVPPKQDAGSYIEDRQTECSSSSPFRPPSSAVPSERTPLLISTTPTEEDPGLGYAGNGTQPSEVQVQVQVEEYDESETKSIKFLIMLTIGMLGLQIMWTAELGQGTPYLLSLGMSKAMTAIVWVAGPLSGIIVQPYVGAMSDNCRIKWGRRKPYMIGGALLSIVFVMLFVWAEKIVACFLTAANVDEGHKSIKIVTIVFAILCFYFLDFSINVLQATLRTFISDVAPTHQQEIANAWSSRLSGIGNVVGYSFGLANLVKTFWFFGHMQVRIIAVVASFFVAVSLAASVAYIKEPDPKRFGDPSKGDMGPVNFLRKSVRAWSFVSEQIKRVCYAQFCNWIGWFPFLFYFSEYVAALYTDPIYAANPHLSPAELTRVKEEGVRVGNVAFLAYALSSLISSMVIPFLIVPAYEKRKFRIAATKAKVPSTESFPSNENTPAPASANTVGVPASLLPSEYASYVPTETAAPVHETQIESSAKRFVRSLQIPGFSLRRAWILSQIVFSLCMFATFLVNTPMGSFVLGGVTGVAWSITAWAPFSIITGEIGKKNDERRARLAATKQRRRPTDSSSVTALPSGSKDDLSLEDKTEEDAANIQAGLILGLHNVAICAPQIIATVVGAAIFLRTQKPIGTAGDNSVAWVFRFGGLAAILAAVMTKRVFETADVTRMSETPFGIRVEKLWANVGGKRFESVVGLIWSMVCNACWTVFGPVLRPVGRSFKAFGRWFMGEKKEATTTTV